MVSVTRAVDLGCGPSLARGGHRRREPRKRVVAAFPRVARPPRARVLPSGFEAVRGDLARAIRERGCARADALLSATIQPSNHSTVEGACFAMMRGRETMRSADMLDFFVVHLSWLERRLALTKPSSSEASASVLVLAVRDDLQAILERHARVLRHQAREAAPCARTRILAVLPFFASGGRGDSSRYSSYALRRAALSATFWSVRAALSAHVVVAVCSEVDAPLRARCARASRR